MPVFIIVDVLVCICVCTTIHNDVYARKLLFFCLMLMHIIVHVLICAFIFAIYDQQIILPIHCIHY